MNHAAPPSHSSPDDLSAEQGFAGSALIPVLVVGTSQSARYFEEGVVLQPKFDLAGVTARFTELGPILAETRQGDVDGEQRGLARQRMLVVLADAGDRHDAADRRALQIEAWASSALKHGHDVLLSGDLALSPDSIDQISNTAANSRRVVRVWRPGLASVRFRNLQQVIASGEAGPIRSMRLVHHAMRDSLLPAIGDAVPATSDRSVTQSTSRSGTVGGEHGHGVLMDFVSHRLAEFFAVCTSRIVRVGARLSFARPEFLQETAAPGDGFQSETGCLAWLETESGMLATLDIDLACIAHVTTDWWVQGTRGGYRSGWQSMTAPDGEIFEVPVAQPPAGGKAAQPGTDRSSTMGNSPTVASQAGHTDRTNTSDMDLAWQELHGLLADARSGEASLGAHGSCLAAELAIARTVAAICQSHTEGRFVDCDIQPQ